MRKTESAEEFIDQPKYDDHVIHMAVTMLSSTRYEVTNSAELEPHCLISIS